MADFKRSSLEYLKKTAEADKAAAETSLALLLNHPAGIGDHSTGDLYENLNEALSKYADARDRLDSLEALIADKFPEINE